MPKQGSPAALLYCWLISYAQARKAAAALRLLQWLHPSQICAPVCRFEMGMGLRPVAGMDFALPSEGRGREFESRRVRQPFQSLPVADHPHPRAAHGAA
jgi:hypothetical protein